MADETRAAEILAAAKAGRRGSSRALWIAALVIAVICGIGFVLLLVADRGPTTQPEAVATPGLGFGAGVLVGVVIGVAIGYAVARQSSRSTP